MHLCCKFGPQHRRQCVQYVRVTRRPPWRTTDVSADSSPEPQGGACAAHAAGMWTDVLVSASITCCFVGNSGNIGFQRAGNCLEADTRRSGSRRAETSPRRMSQSGQEQPAEEAAPTTLGKWDPEMDGARLRQPVQLMFNHFH